jgi:predicted alpha/beta hydrolase family esterase
MICMSEAHGDRIAPPQTMKDVLFIQGAGKGVHAEWDSKLVASLRRELGSRYVVRYPPMPNEDDPTMEAWGPVLERELAALGNGAIVVGHSVGGTMVINVLAESPPMVALDAIVLLAAPFIGEGGWESEEIQPRADLAERLPEGVPVHLFHGEDDNDVPIAHVALYAERIPHAHLHRLAGRDHQFNDDLSDVARVIRGDRPAR